jgi:hypothetical protein
MQGTAEALARPRVNLPRHDFNLIVSARLQRFGDDRGFPNVFKQRSHRFDSSLLYGLSAGLSANPQDCFKDYSGNTADTSNQARVDVTTPQLDKHPQGHGQASALVL